MPQDVPHQGAHQGPHQGAHQVPQEAEDGTREEWMQGIVSQVLEHDHSGNNAAPVPVTGPYGMPPTIEIPTHRRTRRGGHKAKAAAARRREYEREQFERMAQGHPQQSYPGGAYQHGGFLPHTE